jgi:hypothetical protein
LITGGRSDGLALGTLIPTSSGLTPLGQLRVGDSVFDENGQPCTVVGAGRSTGDRACYEIEFSGGSTFIVGADQPWIVDTRKSRMYRLEQTRRAATVGPLGKRRYGAALPPARLAPERRAALAELGMTWPPSVTDLEFTAPVAPAD